MELVKPDIGLLFWMTTCFLILLVILRKFAWGPILNALNERENGIQQALDEASRAREEINSLQDSQQKILNEAIEELKENEFEHLFNKDKKSKTYVKELTIDTDFSLLFPDDYVNNISERLRLYTKLNNLKTTAELQDYENELIDRFGPLPTEVVDLLDSVKMK